MTTGRTSGSSRSARRRPAPASRSPRAPTTPAAAGRPVPGVRAMTPCEARSVASTGATTRCSGPARCTPCGVAPRSPSATGPVTWPGAPPVRLMRDMGLHGVRRAKSPRTTRSAPKGAVPGRPGEPAFRRFRAERAVGGGHRAPRGAVGVRLLVWWQFPRGFRPGSSARAAGIVGALLSESWSKNWGSHDARRPPGPTGPLDAEGPRELPPH